MVSWALKEWQAAVSALLQGQTILLLRKGGIGEARGQFSLAARQVLLLPTTEHQDATLLKTAYRGLIAPDTPPAAAVTFAGWATITHALPLTTPAAVEALLPYLIWNEQFVNERLRWQPDRPLYGLLLRAYGLEAPLALPRHSGYGGCRSWVELGQQVAIDRQRPALADPDYTRAVDAILAAVPAVRPMELGSPNP